MAIMQSRRGFVSSAAVAGAAGFAGWGASGPTRSGMSLAADPPPEVSTFRIDTGPVICLAQRDIRWVTAEPIQLFTEGKIDAFLAVPPILQEVRARNIGHVIASSITDRPWSQYYCCLLGARTEFAHEYPIATKRLIRAILKGAGLCVSQPARVAQLLVDNGYSAHYDYALQAISEIRYDVWRDYDLEDSLRFYALRLHEAGLIKSNPQKLIADHTDWRFLNELKRELKA